MNKELIQKVIRCFVITLCFVGMLTAIGMKEREVQQWGFMLGLMVIFGLLLRNIWLTLFMGWTVFLFAFFKFEVGLVYVTNIFFGCLLYYLVKVAFKKELVKVLIHGILHILGYNHGKSKKEAIEMARQALPPNGNGKNIEFKI